MKFYRISIILLAIISFTNITQAHRSPEGCTGSGLNISLFTNKSEVNIGDSISYGIDIFNGTGPVPISCDATEIQASITTPDGVVHPIPLSRTTLTNTQSDSYSNIVTYVSRTQDVNSNSLRATAVVSGAIHQNDTNSQGGGNQGVNVTVLATIPSVPTPSPTPSISSSPTPSNTPTPTPTPTPSTPTRGGGGGSRSTPTPTPTVVQTPIQPIIPILPNTGVSPEYKISNWDVLISLINFKKIGGVKLIIPSVLIDAELGTSGISNTGEVEASTDPNIATWFNESTKIGEKGTAVVSGHYGWKNNSSAVFDNLEKVKVGDKIYTEVNNKITTFIVRDIKTYDLNDDAESVFNSNDGKSHLNLITCAGKWDSVKKTYSERLVVFSERE